MVKYLWVNRKHYPLFSQQWIRAWLKRIRTVPSMFASAFRVGMLRRRGSCIGNPVFLARCIFNGKATYLTIGKRTFIGRCILHLHDRIDIGENVVINDGAIILTASHDVRSKHFQGTTAPISIGDYAWIATNAILLPGARIGRGAVVGAGAVIRGQIPDFGIAVGNPASVLEHERARELKYDPVRKVALFEAWLGPEAHNQMQM